MFIRPTPFLPSCFLVLTLVTTALAQQSADPHFDARVDKPTFTKNFPRVLFDEAHYNFDTTNNRYKPFGDLLLPVLDNAGFKTFRPDGAYYIMTDISGFGFADDVEFTKHLIREVGVACVPGSSFYSAPERGAQQVRFCFCKKDETLQLAAERLEKLQPRV